MKKLFNRLRNSFIACKVKRRVQDLSFPVLGPTSPYPMEKLLMFYNFKEPCGFVLSNNVWGSAPSYNDSVCTENNVSFTKEGLSIRSEYKDTYGYDWDGQQVLKPWTNGLWHGYPLKITHGLCVGVILKMDNIGSGYWPCPLWIFKGTGFVNSTPMPKNDSEEYFEIDGFEQFIKDDKSSFSSTQFEASVTTHFGKANKRKMLTSKIKHMFELGEWFRVEIIFFRNRIETYWNGYLVYKTTIGVPKEGMTAFPIISDSVSSFNKEINIHDPNIIKNVYGFTVDSLAILIIKD